MNTKRQNKIHVYALCLCLCFLSSTSMAQKHFEGVFSLSDNGFGLLNFYAVIDSNLVIPDTIYAYGKSYPVKRIKYGGFIDVQELKTIKLPNILESIGNNAFENCTNLTSILIPRNVVHIGKDAFLNTNLQHAGVEDGNTRYDSRDNCNAIINSSTNTLVVGTSNSVIPSSIISIGENAFFGRKELQKVLIPKNVITIEKGAFHGCKSLYAVTTESQLPSLKKIGEGAFASCEALNQINLPSSLNEICGWAFHGTSLRSIYIPAHVDTIGEFVLGRCRDLKSIVVDPNNTHYDSRNNCNAIIETKSGRLISGCNNTRIPLGVTTIGKGAFEGMQGLTSIVIPNGVKEMEEGCFWKCDNLESIELPATIVRVDDCFPESDKLKSIIIHSRKPPFLDFRDYRAYQKVTLFVPKGCLKKYAKSSWKYFGKIIER